jgi:hypothetical protein
MNELEKKKRKKKPMMNYNGDLDFRQLSKLLRIHTINMR